MRVSLCASPSSLPHPDMLRRECLHLPFFALPFALFPLCLLYLRKCLVMFLSSVQGKVSQKLSLPSRQTSFVLELVLHASYCNSNGSVRPRERWVVSAYARGQGLKVLQVFKRPFLTRALVNCARKDFDRSDIADNWLVTRHFCFRCVQKCGHADSGTLTLFRRESFLLLLRGVAASASCRTNIVRRLRSQDSRGKIRWFSSCEVHGRPCVPQDSGNPLKRERTCE